jgi:hypothetical protein
MNLCYGPSGITMDDRMMNLSKGWFVVNKDSFVITENEIEWSQIKKTEIKTLGLKWHDKIWTITDKAPYVQFKRGSVSFSPAGFDNEVQCTERCIGYYEGSSKVIYRVDEFTGRMRMCVE